MHVAFSLKYYVLLVLGTTFNDNLECFGFMDHLRTTTYWASLMRHVASSAAFRALCLDLHHESHTGLHLLENDAFAVTRGTLFQFTVLGPSALAFSAKGLPSDCNIAFVAFVQLFQGN